MAKVRVPIAGTVGKSVLIETDTEALVADATGATIGVDFKLPDGSIPSFTELALALQAEQQAAQRWPFTFWNRILEVPPVLDSLSDLVDPNSNSILYWDNTANALAFSAKLIHAETVPEVRLFNLAGTGHVKLLYGITDTEGQIATGGGGGGDLGLVSVTGVINARANTYIRSGNNFRVYDGGDTDYGQFSHDGTDFINSYVNTASVIYTGATFHDFLDSIRIRSANALTIFDTTNLDSASFSHDGNDFNTLLTNTIDWNITGGVLFKVFDSSGVDYILLAHNGSEGQIATNNNSIELFPQNLRVMSVTSGGVQLRFGRGLTFFDTAEDSDVDFDHDGTDFNTVFTGTTDWNITGATGVYAFDAITRAEGLQARTGTWVQVFDPTNIEFGYLVSSASNFQIRTRTGGGANIQIFSDGGFTTVVGDVFRIQDVGATDSVNFFHDGVDFLVTGVNTTDIEFHGFRWHRFFEQTGTGDNLILLVSASAVHFEAAGGTAKPIEFLAQSGQSYRFMSGLELRVQDAANTDWGAFQHDGADFNLSFTNTADWNIFGAGQTMHWGDDAVPQLLGAGGPFTTAPVKTMNVQADTALTTANVEYHLSIDDALANNRRARFFLSDENGEFGLQGSASSGVPTFGLYVGVTKAISVENDLAQRWWDTTGIDYLDLRHDGTSVRVTANGTTSMRWDIVDCWWIGSHQRIYDATGIDYRQDSHDGINFNSAFVGTTNWNMRDGIVVRVFDTTDNDSINFSHNGTDGVISTTGVTPGSIRLEPGTDVQVIGGAGLSFWDSTNNDNGRFSHDGVDALLAFTNTGIWNITGADVDIAEDLTVNKAFSLSGEISPAQLVANTNDWAPTGLADAVAIRASTDASRNLTGLTGGVAGRIIIIHNIGANNLVLTHADAASTAANRFLLPNATVVTLQVNESIALRYDGTSSRWRPIGVAT